MSEIVFDWMDFYQAFADRLLDYKNNREELIVKFKKIYVDANIKWSCLEKDSEGNFIDPSDIDPFTVVGVFNRIMTDENRFRIIKVAKEEFSISEEIPTSFAGIPRIRPISPRFYAYEYEGRQEDDIDNLWEVFEAAINYSGNPHNEHYRNDFIKWFDKVKGQKGVGLSYFTTGLFWIRPYTFINLDSRNLKFIADSNLFSDDLVSEVKSIKGFPSGELYLKICEECSSVIEDSDYEHLVEFSCQAFFNDIKDKNEVSLKKDFQKVLDEYLKAREEIGYTNAPIAHHIQQTLKNEINGLVDEPNYKVNAYAGVGRLSETPWIDVFKPENANNISSGYFFKADMTGVYLVLRVCHDEELEKKYGMFVSEHLRSIVININSFLEDSPFDINYFDEPFDLNSKSKTADIHKSGIILSKLYEKDNIPSDEILKNDLKQIIKIQDYIYDNYSDNMYLTVDEWIEALEDENLIDKKTLNILEINYNFEDHTASYEDIIKKREELGYPNEKTYTSNIVKTSKRLKERFNKTEIYGSDEKEIWVPRFFYGARRRNPNGKNVFYNTLREELVEALENYDKSKRPDRIAIVPPKDSSSPKIEFDSFYDYLIHEGYYFSRESIENYLLSLKVKPFVILTGNSGTGKTKLSQLFAKYLNEKDNYKIIPVGANWTENRHILGFFNILENEPQYTPAYYLIEKSQEKSYPHFLILDEMNLSHVERYFADFLSAIESNEAIPLHGEDEIEIPSNLFIIGTVNVDETTYMFSPKVLDRANTIEFKTYSAKDYMTNKFNMAKPKGNIEYLEDILIDQKIWEKPIQKMSIQELQQQFDNDGFWQEFSDEMFKFQNILKKAGFDFGFRVINEITRFMLAAYKYENKPENWTNWKRYFDAQIKQKMLPKLHGSQKVIGETLDELLEACVSYPDSKAKLEEMTDVLDKQRYVSFIN